jgi:hypothetical protein
MNTSESKLNMYTTMPPAVMIRFTDGNVGTLMCLPTIPWCVSQRHLEMAILRRACRQHFVAWVTPCMESLLPPVPSQLRTGHAHCENCQFSSTMKLMNISASSFFIESTCGNSPVFGDVKEVSIGCQLSLAVTPCVGFVSSWLQCVQRCIHKR